MDFNQIPINPYGQELQVNAAPGMMDPSLMGDPYSQQMFPGNESSPLPDQEYKQLHSFMVDGGDRYGVSCLCFDTQELLWMGNQGGHVTSYYGPSLQKYTSFQVHQNEEVRQMAPLKDRGMLSLTQSSLRLSLRRGLSQFVYQGSAMHDMQCMLVTSPSSLLIAGHHSKVIELDLTTGKERQKFEVKDPGCAILRHSSKYICAGDTSGRVTLYDPNNMKSEHVFEAHSGTLSDFDIHGNLLVTCGYSNRLGNLTPDRYLMMYDMRMMRAMSPLQLIIDPTFLRFVPTYSSRVAIVSQVGQFQVIEATGTTSLAMYQVQCHNGIVLSFDVTSTCQALTFGDSGGYLHMFATDENVTFNSFHEVTDLADPVEPSQNIHIHDFTTPYAMVPMSYPNSGKLLSEWPDYLCDKVYRKAKAIDPEVLRSMKVYQNVGYAPNPGKEKRNQIPYMKQTEGTKKGKSNVPESPLGRGDDPFMAVPKRFRKVDLKYSKLGLEDFDFRHYNKTHFAGLEIHIPNVYCNSMLQMFYFIEPLRVKLLNHLCEREFCLSCELAFLFHMLDIQKGQTCQASNFLRAFRTLPEAAALGLVLAENEEVAGRVNLGRLIQSWQRFMHQQIHSETLPKVAIEDKKDKEGLEGEKEDNPVEGATAEPAVSLTTDESDKLTVEEKKEKEEKEKEVKKEEPKASSKSKKKKKKGKKESKKEDKKSANVDQVNVPVLVPPADQLEIDTSSTPTESPREEKEKKEGSVVTDIFGLETVTTLRCRCGQDNKRQATTTLVNLNYPDCSGQGLNKGPVPISFVQVLEHSLTLEQNTQAWCNHCAKYQQHQQTKEVLSLPDVLALNCQLENPRDLEFWKIQLMLLRQKEEGDSVSSASSSPIPHSSSPVMCRYGRKCTKKGCRFRHEHDSKDWLQDDLMKIHTDDENDPVWIPFGLKVQLQENGSLKIDEFSDEDNLPDNTDHLTKYYDLLGTVSNIKDSKGGGHLVSHIKVGETYHQRKEGVTTTQWYLFNDFSISDVEKEEAVRFNLEWRIPCTIYFVRRNMTNYHDLQVNNPITKHVLSDESTLINPKRRKMTFAPLTEEEYPKEGDIIGLDAEFVSLNQEESELRSDGTRSTLRPSHMSVARITCIRGQGALLGEPFVDDYICTHEQVVDYLTQYSGIKPGDLDPNVSNRHLTTLKATYQKIRYLVDSGLTFIGHGLKKDFRVININVPKDQIIDTVELFHLPRQRMISLKFLAWYFLKINIQSVTHDSVEDARTAIQLYLKYLEMSKDGMDSVRKTIKEMYELGRKIQWKIPDIEEEATEDSVVAFL